MTMDLDYGRKRIVDVARGFRRARVLTARERWPRERLAALQLERIDALVRDAIARSPFYRERLGPHVGRASVELAALPVLDKATMMERFDELVTDPRLRREALLEHLEDADGDELLDGEFRVMATSGSSGRKGLYVYDRSAWIDTVVAPFLRINAIIGVRPQLPRLRVAAIGGGAPTHMTRRGAATFSLGLHRLLSLPVTMPVDEMAAALEAHRPEYMTGFASRIALLADERLAGRLRIAPRVVQTSSELCTPEMRARIQAAFGVAPFNFFATTEGLWGSSCAHGSGVHLFEDVVAVENVDADGRSVSDGERGAKLLVTNLVNRTQPLIRFEVSDIVSFDPEPCPCGRTLRRLRTVQGRAEDVLRLCGRDGPVEVHPLHFSLLTSDRDVREFQVVQDRDRVRLRVVLHADAAAEAARERLRERVAARLAEAGVHAPRVDVEPCATIERPPSGKLKLVVADGG
jgi:putative adenylate-forming enzyme